MQSVQVLFTCESRVAHKFTKAKTHKEAEKKQSVQVLFTCESRVAHTNAPTTKRMTYPIRSLVLDAVMSP
jgi:hypothetical protein